MLKITCRFLLIGILYMAYTSPVLAQSFSRATEIRSNLTSYYFHSMPGEATVQVYLWGTVRHPGVYEISSQTDLGQLLSFAGGPDMSPREGSDQRQIIVRLYRQQGNQQVLAYETQLDQMKDQESQQYPIVQDEDLILVDTIEHRRFNWRDAFTIVGSLAALALAVERTVRVAQ